MTGYRYPSEHVILGVTMIAIFLVTVFAAGVTLCIGPVLFAIIVGMAYYSNKAHHQELMQHAIPVNPQQTPGLTRIAGECHRRIQPGPLQVYVVPQRAVNAYTFGISDPKVVVLFSATTQVMDEDELRFIIGHEMGHAALGHAWLNTMLGGMAGVPVPFAAAVILTLAFRSWNRTCEYSADRAGLLACANPNKAVSALIKLFAADARTPADLQRALALIEQEDDSPLNLLAESLSTHPMLVRRIEQLKRWSQSEEYRRLQAQVLRQ
jgi:Zn-dependent protease with chaperone function